MIERRDGTFTENMTLENAFDMFKQQMEDEPSKFKALHVGSEKELDEVREKADMQTQLDKLSAKVDSIEKPKSDFIHIPTQEEIKQLG